MAQPGPVCGGCVGHMPTRAQGTGAACTGAAAERLLLKATVPRDPVEFVLAAVRKSLRGVTFGPMSRSHFGDCLSLLTTQLIADCPPAWTPAQCSLTVPHGSVSVGAAGASCSNMVVRAFLLHVGMTGGCATSLSGVQQYCPPTEEEPLVAACINLRRSTTSIWHSL